MQADQLRASVREYVQALKDGQMELASKILNVAIQEGISSEFIMMVAQVKKEEGF